MNAVARARPRGRRLHRPMLGAHNARHLSHQHVPKLAGVLMLPAMRSRRVFAQGGATRDNNVEPTPVPM
jgi:hypothetical protein